MNSTIQNPTRTITLPTTIKEAVTAFEHVSKVLDGKKYKFTEHDDFLNIYRFEVLEFLSLGSIIIINLVDKGESTDVKIEVQRALGAFDNWVEAGNANKHIKTVSSLISDTLNPNKETPKIVIKKQNIILRLLKWAFWAGILYALFLAIFE